MHEPDTLHCAYVWFGPHYTPVNDADNITLKKRKLYAGGFKFSKFLTNFYKDNKDLTKPSSAPTLRRVDTYDKQNLMIHP